MSKNVEKRVKAQAALARENRRMLLRRWSAKARCNRTQKVAYRLWGGLRPCLTKVEASSLLIAWAHAEGDEGPRELDGLVRGMVGRVNRLRSRP